MKVKIGLETHVQLNSKSKLLCGCKNPVTLKEEPKQNTLTCPTCLGLPGSRPRINEAVLASAIKACFALNCKVSGEIGFSRKTYFYPDMSKNFQVTQYEVPLGRRGHLKVGKKKVRVRRVHVEEDPAKLVHTGRVTLVDYNRSGIPLIEIVTEPDFSTPKEARLYLQKLELILEYLGIYSPGSRAVMKSDANISLQLDRKRKKKGAKQEEGTRVEVKNITGAKEIEQALTYEIMRQSSIKRRGGKVVRGTRAWDPDGGVTKEMRGKEEVEEYGYITEPDLTRIEIPGSVREKLKKGLPELPDQRLKRYVKQFKLPEKVAESIISDVGLPHLFEKAAAKTKPKVAGSWIAGYLKKTLNYSDLSYRESGVRDSWVIYLLDLFTRQRITDRNAELAMRKMVKEKRHPGKIVKEEGYLVKRFDVELLLRKVVKGNEKAVKDFRKGEKKALNFLVGLAVKETQGTVHAKTIRKELVRMLK